MSCRNRYLSFGRRTKHSLKRCRRQRISRNPPCLFFSRSQSHGNTKQRWPVRRSRFSMHARTSSGALLSKVSAFVIRLKLNLTFSSVRKLDTAVQSLKSRVSQQVRRKRNPSSSELVHISRACFREWHDSKDFMQNHEVDAKCFDPATYETVTTLADLLQMRGVLSKHEISLTLNIPSGKALSLAVDRIVAMLPVMYISQGR